MALGAGNVTPMQMLAAYSIFANGGFRVTPYFITRVEDSKGNILFEAKPARAGGGAERAIDERNAYVMTSLMRDVVRAGTAASAMRLGRGDLAGKTGTTNDFLDAWFGGYNASLVGIVWVGFDQPQSLGRNETGGNVALPIWINFMATALKGVPEKPFVTPQGMVTVGGEVFYQEFAPRTGESEASAMPEAARNELF
jgi:penicillin-binding protein 1A